MVDPRERAVLRAVADAAARAADKYSALAPDNLHIESAAGALRQMAAEIYLAILAEGKL